MVKKQQYGKQCIKKLQSGTTALKMWKSTFLICYLINFYTVGGPGEPN